jgi:hypothetical protein
MSFLPRHVRQYSVASLRFLSAFRKIDKVSVNQTDMKQNTDDAIISGDNAKYQRTSDYSA